MEAIQSPAATLGAWVTPISQKPGPWIFICLGIALTFLATQLSSPRPPSRQLPYVNAPSIFDVFAVVPRQRFVFHARDIFARARARYPGQLYRLMTDTGETIVIPSNQVHDVRKEPGLSFLEAFANSFHPHLPGFEALREIARPDELFLVVIKKHITKLLRAWIRFQSVPSAATSGPFPHVAVLLIVGPGSQTRSRSLWLSKQHMPSITSLVTRRRVSDGSNACTLPSSLVP